MGGISDDDSDLSDDDLSPKKRRDLLTRRPSYRKILNDLGGAEIGKLISLFDDDFDDIYKRARI